MKEIMSSRLVTCSVDTPQHEVIELVKQYGLLALPVISHEGTLAGIVTFDDVLSLL